MTITFDHLLNSSFLLYLNNLIQTKGQSFTNYTGKFYPTLNTINNYYTYALPFSQICSDISVAGASIPTGIYINGTFAPTGTNNFIGFNYEKGHAYFNTPTSNISGIFAIKDFNINLLTQPELRLFFEGKMSLNPKTTFQQAATGAPLDGLNYPCILVVPMGGTNKPFAFGGQDMTESNFGLFVFADSQFKLDLCNSIIRDSQKSYVPLLSQAEMPYNPLGGIKNDTFNYTGLVSGKIGAGNAAFIDTVEITFYRREIFSNVLQLNPEVYFSVVDVKLMKNRYPRSTNPPN